MCHSLCVHRQNSQNTYTYAHTVTCSLAPLLPPMLLYHTVNKSVLSYFKQLTTPPPQPEHTMSSRKLGGGKCAPSPTLLRGCAGRCSP